MKIIDYMAIAIAALFSAAALVSCSPEGEGVNGANVALKIDKDCLDFGAAAGEQVFNVETSGKLYVVPGADWISASAEASGTPDKYSVTVSATENVTREERTTRISVVAGDEKKYVEVRQQAKASEPVPEPGDNAAWQVLDKLGMGWNLGNQLDAHNNGVAGETVWGNPKAAQALFDKVRAAGYKSVRIPVTWLGKFGEAPEYKIDNEWLDRVAEVVGYAENAGLNAIINIHHDGGDSKYWLDIKTAAVNDVKNAQIRQQIRAMWSQIALKFRDKGDFLIFEAFNEIHDGKWGWGDNRTDGGKQYRCLNGWNQEFVDAVRSTGGNNASRLLVVPGYCTNIDFTVSDMVLPEDTAEDRLIVAVHYYDPGDYTLNAKYSEWGHTGDPSKKAPGSNEEQVTEAFAKLYDKFISNGVPVYIGEMGCGNRATEREQKFQRYWFEYVVKAAKTYGMSTFVWDNGAEGAGAETHAYFNHATGEFPSEGARKAVETMVRAMNNDDPSYTLESVYANAPK